MINKRLDIFDLDDSLIKSVTFSELLPKDEYGNISLTGEFGEFMEKVKSFFYIVFSKEVLFKPEGDFIVVYDTQKKVPLGEEYIGYIQDLNPDSMTSYGLKRGVVKDMLRALGLYEKHIVFKNIPQFHENPETIGKIVNDQVFEDYRHAQNKMILTGRNIKLKSLIEQRLAELQLDLPNYGVHCFPGDGKISIQQFKINTILNSIVEYDWSQIHFYEDKREWLEAAMNAVKVQYPEVAFYPHLIAISKRMKSL